MGPLEIEVPGSDSSHTVHFSTANFQMTCDCKAAWCEHKALVIEDRLESALFWRWTAGALAEGSPTLCAVRLPVFPTQGVADVEVWLRPLPSGTRSAVLGWSPEVFLGVLSEPDSLKVLRELVIAASIQVAFGEDEIVCRGKSHDFTAERLLREAVSAGRESPQYLANLISIKDHDVCVRCRNRIIRASGLLGGDSVPGLEEDIGYWSATRRRVGGEAWNPYEHR